MCKVSFGSDVASVGNELYRDRLLAHLHALTHRGVYHISVNIYTTTLAIFVTVALRVYTTSTSRYAGVLTMSKRKSLRHVDFCTCFGTSSPTTPWFDPSLWLLQFSTISQKPVISPDFLIIAHIRVRIECTSFLQSATFTCLYSACSACLNSSKLAYSQHCNIAATVLHAFSITFISCPYVGQS